mmetsp:Transcript_11600/g.34457  ORF Transcript_11600/g.34457 Transcript_11600/m.34457 type:complete len:256 (-) Transcript_11600:9887-10654(-)
MLGPTPRRRTEFAAKTASTPSCVGTRNAQGPRSHAASTATTPAASTSTPPNRPATTSSSRPATTSAAARRSLGALTLGRTTTSITSALPPSTRAVILLKVAAPARLRDTTTAAPPVAVARSNGWGPRWSNSTAQARPPSRRAASSSRATRTPVTVGSAPSAASITEALASARSGGVEAPAKASVSSLAAATLRRVVRTDTSLVASAAMARLHSPAPHDAANFCFTVMPTGLLLPSRTTAGARKLDGAPATVTSQS